MSREEIRQNNNKSIDENSETGKRVKAQGNRRLISSKLQELLYDNPEELTAYCQAMLQSAKAGNMTAVAEINNRIEGKVKEEIKVDLDVSTYVPDQAEQAELTRLFRKNAATDAVN